MLETRADRHAASTAPSADPTENSARDYYSYFYTVLYPGAILCYHLQLYSCSYVRRYKIVAAAVSE